MKLMISGSRFKYLDDKKRTPLFKYEEIEIFLKYAFDKYKEKYPDLIIVHGKCRESPDMVADKVAKELDIPIETYPADWKKYGKKAGFLRNAEMVEIADEIWAFWDGESKGTQHSIKLGKEKGIKTEILLIESNEV